MKNISIYNSGVLLVLAISAVAIWKMSVLPPQIISTEPIAAKIKNKVAGANTTAPDYATSLRISDTEKQIAILNDQMAQIMDENRLLRVQLLANSEIDNEQNQASNETEQSNLPESSDHYANEKPSIESEDENGLMSEDWTAEQDRLQSEYVNKVSVAFDTQGLDDDSWSADVELASIHAMNTLDNTGAVNGASEQGDIQSSETSAIQASMSNFSCRGQLCEAQFQAASLKDLIAYQSQMVDKLSENLPTIVFDVPVESGGQYTMRAYLARDGYEFPAVN